MRIYYISPSVIPSRAANSIHVVNMCEALTKLEHDVVLFARSEKMGVEQCRKEVKEFYGIDDSKIDISIYKSMVGRGAEIIIALFAYFKYIKDYFLRQTPELIISRNLYGAVIFGLLLRQKIVYETHAPEQGFRKVLQKIILKAPNVHCIVISDALRRIISELHGVSIENITVLHDAARVGQSPMSINEKLRQREILLGDVVSQSMYSGLIGYFGHLYSGRGIEIIQEMAVANQNSAFIIYGGNENEINQHRLNNKSNNLYYMGHLQPSMVRKAMAMMDVLLMPYQKSVSVGLNGVDTVLWMSPMKLFEYMSVGVPIISSDLPVLREVLIDKKNSLLVSPDRVVEWNEALESIVGSSSFGESISSNAYALYLKKYTWVVRAERMTDLVNG